MNLRSKTPQFIYNKHRKPTHVLLRKEVYDKMINKLEDYFDQKAIEKVKQVPDILWVGAVKKLNKRKKLSRNHTTK